MSIALTRPQIRVLLTLIDPALAAKQPERQMSSLLGAREALLEELSRIEAAIARANKGGEHG